jgi:pimeloyl-ACP methyl ester carboxylesterase
MKKAMISLLASALLLGGLAACSDNDRIPAAQTFVLVHGAWQAPYAWQYVKGQLEQKGQKVVVVELPGHGSDQTAPAALTLDRYRDKVVAAIEDTPGRVILVGHSMGGMVISAAAEQTPQRLEKLVYIGAFLPANRQSLLELASTDATSLLGAALLPSQDQLTLGLRSESIVPVFIQDGSDAVKKEVVDNYRPEPAIPFTNAVSLTDGRFGKIAKYYVHTTQDKAVGLPLQQRMVAAAPNIEKVYSLNSGHCPFLSMPHEVTSLLLEIAREKPRAPTK